MIYLFENLKSIVYIYIYIYREFFTKWWDKFRPTDTISKLYKDFPLLVQKSIAHCTRSQSSLDSVQFSKKSSKELKDLAQQLLLQS